MKARLLALALCAALFAPCARAQQVPSLSPGTAQQRSAALYFRFYDTEYVAEETRTIRFDPSLSFERALVEALLSGPSSVYPHLGPLFPQGTRVLSAHGQGSVLFVTFDQNLMNPYPDEVLTSSAYRGGEGLTRRALAMASLSLTVTENTDYAYVQPLVMGDLSASASLRLSERYYLKDSDALPPPLSRAEDRLLTPFASASLLLSRWQAQDRAGMPMLMLGGQAQALDSLPQLLDFSLSRGTVSADGQSATVLLSASLREKDGGMCETAGWPLRLKRVQGAWLTDVSSLDGLKEATP